jgi:hypothetical protein
MVVHVYNPSTRKACAEHLSSTCKALDSITGKREEILQFGICSEWLWFDM